MNSHENNNLNNLPNSRGSKINLNNITTPEITPIHNPNSATPYQRNKHNQITDLRHFLQHKLPRKTVVSDELLLSIKNRIDHNEM